MGTVSESPNSMLDAGQMNAGRLLIQRIRWDELPGALSKTLEVLPGQIAVCQDTRGNLQSLEAGRHRIVGLWGILNNAQGVCYVAFGELWSIHVVIHALPTADDMSVDADFLVTVKLIDLSKLVTLIHPLREGLVEAELSAAIAEKCEQHLPGLTRAYLAHDLCYTPSVARSIEGMLSSFLSTYLVSWGLRAQSVTHLVFVPTQIALERAERLLAFQDGLARLEQKQILAEHERRRALEELLSPETDEENIPAKLESEEGLQETRALETGVSAPPLASAGEPPTVQSSADQRHTPDTQSSLEITVAARLDRYLRRSDQEQASAISEDPIRKLQQAVAVFRWSAALFGTGLAFLVTSAPWLFPDAHTPNLIATAVSFGGTLVSFVVSFLLQRRVRLRRQQMALQAQLLGRLNLQGRQEADQVVREEVSGFLEQTANNIETARSAVFRTDAGRSLAVELNNLLHEIRRARNAILSAPTQDVPWLNEKHLHPKLLLAMLIFDESVLRSAFELAHLSERLASLAIAKDLAQTQQLAQELRAGLLYLQNRFQERGRLTVLADST